MTKTIAFFDSLVDQHSALASGLPADTENVVLDPWRDGVEQIGTYLLGRTGLAAIHVVSHGTPGALCLGNAVVSSASLVGHAPWLRAIGQALVPGGDILLYGCHVAAGAVGQSFIDSLAAITGANVAASADATGATARGGHAALEVGVGTVRAMPLFTQSTLDRLDVLLGNLPAQVLPNTGAVWMQTNIFGDFSQPGTITNSTEVLRFEFVPNTTGNHTFTIPGSSLDAMFRVYGSNGTPLTAVIDAQGANAAETVTLSLTEGSPVQIAVTGFNTSTGAFTFSVNGPSAITPDLIPPAPTFSNTWNADISPQGDIDYWRLVAPAGTTSLNISVAPTGFDSVFALFNSAGVFLQEIDNGGIGTADTIFNLGVTAGATMFLGVQGFTRTSTGSYAITLDYAPDQASGDPPATVTPLNGTLLRLNPFGNVTATDSIGSATEVDIYAFHVETPGSHVISASGAVDAQLRAYDANGAPLTGIIDGLAAGGTESISVNFTSVGWAYIAVGGFTTSTGGYSVSVNGPDYNLVSIPTPAPVFTGSNNGSVNEPGDVDYWSITAPSGTSSLNVTVTPSAGLDTFTEIYNSSGVRLQSFDTGGAGTNDLLTNFSVTGGGTFFVGVSGFNRTSTGSYDISVDFNPDQAVDQGNPPASVTPLTGTLLRLNPFGDVNFNGSIGSTAEFDVYAFHVETAGNHVIDVNGNFDTQLRVYDANGNALTGVLDATGNGGTESTTLSFSAATGWIYAAVGGFGSSTGTYNFAVNGPTYQIIEPIPTPAPSFTGALNGISSVSPAGDVDYYSITAPSGTSSVNVTVTPAGGLDTFPEIYNSSGVRLQNFDTGGTGSSDQLTNFSVTGGNTFFVGVSGFNRTSTGTYDISVDFNPDQSDTTPPTVTNFSPSQGQTAVPVAANIVLTFSENIVFGNTGSILITDVTGFALSYTSASPQVSISGNVLTINPTADLSPSRNFLVQISNGFIKDSAGNSYAGTGTYNFNTGSGPDITAPTATNFSPADEATNVGVTSDIVVTFSEAIQRGTGTIVLRNAAGSAIETYQAASAGQIQISGNVLTLNPSADLAFGNGYRVDFDFGSVKDLAGNNYTGTTTYNFSTSAAQDTTAPFVQFSSPADEATGVAVGSNIVLTFNEAIQRGAGTIVLRNSAGTAIETYQAGSAAQISINGNVLTLNPSADLAFSTGYRVDFDFGSVKDLAGNNYTGTTTYNFSTSAALDNTPPTVQSFSPADEATGVTVGSDIVLSFSEAIQRGAGTIVLRTAAGVAIETYQAASAAQISINGNVLTLNPSVDLLPGTGYRVDFDFGSVKDLAGNVYVGTTTYNFTTLGSTSTVPTLGDDLLTGTAGPDTINALAGNDIVNAGAGDDTVDGGPGSDIINGGTGSDTALYGGLRADYLLSRDSRGVVRVADKFGVMDTLTDVEFLRIGSETIATSTLRYQPETILPPSNDANLVFRFFNVRDSAYFYTSSVAERDFIIQQSTDPAFTPLEPVWPYYYQGSTFEQAHSSAGAVSVYRFYNRDTGHHFFTTSEAEREYVFRESTDPSFGVPGPVWPFNFEGVAYQAFTGSNHIDAQPVFRFYSPTLNRHFFTASADEAQEIRLTGVWNDEGIGYFGEVPGG